MKVENKGVTPVRVDPEDFACAVGNSVVGIEPTWSGPPARSLLKNSSMDLLVTFKAKAGYEPVLLYSPSWYDGTIRVRQPSPPTTRRRKPSPAGALAPRALRGASSTARRPPSSAPRRPRVGTAAETRT